VRILVVEDERIIARELKDRLIHMGHTVVDSVASGEAAVEKVRTLGADLVLMDIKLQGEMDGIEAAEIIRLETGLPVVYLTAFADESTLQRAKLTEPYGYILKPFQERELHVSIEMSIYRHRVRLQEREQLSFQDAVLQSAGDGIIATGLDGTVKLMNRQAERLTGWPAAEAFGTPLEEVYRGVESTEPAGDATAPSQTLIARDGSECRVEQEAVVIRDRAGAVLGSMRVFRDASRGADVAAELERAEAPRSAG
jgi:two-component system, cell cycle sensor histidine kinase and response regulator CckA